jgi:hypothetical protein
MSNSNFMWVPEDGMGQVGSDRLQKGTPQLVAWMHIYTMVARQIPIDQGISRGICMAGLPRPGENNSNTQDTSLCRRRGTGGNPYQEKQGEGSLL